MVSILFVSQNVSSPHSLTFYGIKCLFTKDSWPAAMDQKSMVLWTVLVKLSKLYGSFYKAKLTKFVFTSTKKFKKNRNSKEFCNIEVLKNSQKFYKYKSGFIRRKIELV